SGGEEGAHGMVRCGGGGNNQACRSRTYLRRGSVGRKASCTNRRSLACTHAGPLFVFILTIVVGAARAAAQSDDHAIPSSVLGAQQQTQISQSTQIQMDAEEKRHCPGATLFLLRNLRRCWINR